MNNVISFHSLFLCVCVFVPVYFAALYWNRRNDRQHTFVKQQNLNQKKKKMEKGQRNYMQLHLKWKSLYDGNEIIIW